MEISRIGADQQPVAVIDDFHAEAAALVAAAATTPFSPALNLYPGVRAPVPDGYWSHDHIRQLKRCVAQAFNISGELCLLDSSFSMVTTAPDALDPLQRLPHPDAFCPRHIALVHYLAPDFSGGTAFFRHRSTGLQTITEHNRSDYFGELERELHRDGPPAAGYIRGDTQLFAQIHEVASKFNRAVLYRGQQLHSGVIEPGVHLSADPTKGRLTVTAFMTVR